METFLGWTLIFLCIGGEKYHPCFLQGAYSLHYKSSPHTPHNSLSPDPLKICDSSHIYIFSNLLEVVRLFFAHFRTWRGNLSTLITCVWSNGQITLLSPFFLTLKNLEQKCSFLYNFFWTISYNCDHYTFWINM